MKLTLISDTHTFHTQVTNDLPGGDFLIHAGDSMSTGYRESEIIDFLDWMEHDVKGYKHKMFIAGNHDWIFENQPEHARELVAQYAPSVEYLQDEPSCNTKVKVYGSPWQPEFCDWAFNLPRKGNELFEKWDDIPEETDILVTHGPRYGYLDYTVAGSGGNVGCEALDSVLLSNPPKIHVFGHVHSGYGYKWDGKTHHINASVLNDNYKYTNQPINIEWNKETNEVTFDDNIFLK